ncbi:MAG: carbon-nitrogen family hydrolase [Myxococcota bacterium]
MRVALLQLDLAWEDAAQNHVRAERRLNEAAAMGARLAILPELFCSGFTMDTAKCAEPEGGPTETFLRDVAAGLGIHVIAGVPVLPGPRNCAVWVSPAGEVRRYAKIHPFSFGDETKHYVAGDRVVTWEIEGLRVTPFVCYDLRFPEPFRLAAAGTDVFVVIGNWPARRAQHWRTLLRARAIENQAFAVGVNRVGEGGGLAYEGHSTAVDPLGETIVEAAGQETVLACEIDPNVVSRWRETFPALRDRKATYG